MQHIMATGNNPIPYHAAMMPIPSDTMPESGVSVVCIMSGKVMTANVT